MLAKRGESAEPARKPAKRPAKAARPRRKKGDVSIKGLTAPEVTGDTPTAEIEVLGQAIRESGGAVVGSYRDPAGGHWHLLASLPMRTS
jgi:ParB family chromosome partitioning protein